MCLTDEESEQANFMLIIVGIELPFKADLSKETDAGKDQSFRSVWNLHLTTYSWWLTALAMIMWFLAIIS